MENKPRKILIFRTEHIGDYAISLPFIKAIREKYLLAKIDLVVGPWNKEFAESTPYVDNIIIWDNPLVKRHIKILDFLNPVNIIKIISFFTKVRREKYDFVIAFSNRKFIKAIIKFFKANRKVAGFDYLENESEVERLDRMMSSLGIKKSNTPIKLKLTKNKEKGVENITRIPARARIVIHPLTPLEEKNWSLENWAELINKLNEKNEKIIFCIIGTEKDREKIEFLISKLISKEHVINLAGKLNIAQTIRLISKSSLIIGGDSGPVHFAELTNTPILALFGPTDERRWGFTKKANRIIKKSKMEEISIEEVLEKINL